MHVLVAEDDRDIGELIIRYIQKNGWTAHLTPSGTEALAYARQHAVNLAILDLMLPGMTGLEICRALRSERAPPPFPSSWSRPRPRRATASSGSSSAPTTTCPSRSAPTSSSPGRGRCCAAPSAPSPRARSSATGRSSWTWRRTSSRPTSKEVKLTAKEFMLLQYMLQRQGRVLSRDLLLSDVWGYRYTGGTRTVDVHVRRLREKLPVLVDALVTVKQFGYKLADRLSDQSRDDHQRPPQAVHRLHGRGRLAVITMALLVPWQLRAQERATIQRRLADESKLIADLLSSARDITEADMDREADRLGTLVSGRVTLIAGDGRVVGDSTQSPDELKTLENHASRPEVLAAAGGSAAPASATAPRCRPTWSTWPSARIIP